MSTQQEMTRILKCAYNKYFEENSKQGKISFHTFAHYVLREINDPRQLEKHFVKNKITIPKGTVLFELSENRNDNKRFLSPVGKPLPREIEVETFGPLMMQYRNKKYPAFPFFANSNVYWVLITNFASSRL